LVYVTAGCFFRAPLCTISNLIITFFVVRYKSHFSLSHYKFVPSTLLVIPLWGT